MPHKMNVYILYHESVYMGKKTYLANNRKTTQMMINISAIATRIIIMAGLTGPWLGAEGSCLTATANK